MDTAVDFVTDINDTFWYAVIALLIGSGLYYTIRSRFIQIRLLPDMLRSIVEKPERQPNGEPGLSAFRAFSVSAASRVGTGNVAGVAIAISLGGPGAVFWMWAMALVGAATAFLESTLAQLYKVRDEDGSFRGGPAYYMQYGLRKRWMGMIFAVIITITYGFVFNAVQTNSIVDAVSSSVGEKTMALQVIVGLAVALIVGAVIFGGIRRISGVSQIVVPVLAFVYLVIGIIVVVLNIGEVPTMFRLIVENAFGLEEVIGGGFGAAFMNGIRRGLFSNEAGMGSAPNAGAAAAVSHPVKQGLVQSLGVYFDTLLVCSITAFIILLSEPEFGSGLEGAALTQNALALQLGDWTVHFLAVLIFFLAFTSVIGNYYYSESNMEFLTGSRRILPYLRSAVVLCVFLGAIGSLPLVWALADLAMGIMATVNLIALIPLSGIAYALFHHYSAQRKQGRDPVFRAGDVPGLRGIQVWNDDDVTPVESRSSDAR
ncbi:alanine:cation symporter family protein [Rhodococcus pyridinivorans]|uniref:alanine/glycine:cation symporter family protein n=1 Tax=Rhodococcus TaxID=1827 RepID=UPI000570485B|nr:MULTISPECIES: alanine/glycine:cation symporter family protein [Rhodococcus]APE11158.1 sodium:alanine symporter family protein [Rhodococcus sp. 2G]AWZ23201.1 alanine:cation symporter family protein [Rhodococcus pyridinivorans]KHJ73755.1 sodium:alanine symporter [Rhodococcus sp. Chr-9]MBX4168778.1 alanine:cation symporter family protein [Rhodococcus sp. DMU2021]MCD5419608.1 alanine:cation symporter family protein [Rhodococcus pyridinivorans]